MCGSKHEYKAVDLSRVVTGDKNAWDTFVFAYSRYIYRAVLRILRIRSISITHNAEDIAQDVFVRIIKNNYQLLRTYDPERATLPAWLTVIASSVTLNRLRHPEFHHDVVRLDDTLPAKMDAAYNGQIDLPARLLTKRQMQILNLLYNEEMDVNDVASTLGVTRQTVRSIKHQAIERLRKYYSRDDESC